VETFRTRAVFRQGESVLGSSSRANIRNASIRKGSAPLASRGPAEEKESETQLCPGTTFFFSGCHLGLLLRAALRGSAPNASGEDMSLFRAGAFFL
jgi:hypothetical protein